MPLMMPRGVWSSAPLSTGSSHSQPYLLIGKERFLKREFVDDLRLKLFPEGSDTDSNILECLSPKDGIRPFFDFLATAPFLADKRLGVWWNLDTLKEDAQDILLAELDRLPSTAVAVFMTEQTNAKKTALLRKISERMTVVTCHPPFDKDLPGWIEGRSKKIGVLVDRPCALYLADCFGSDLARQSMALQQLSLYVHPKNRASLEDAKKLFHRTCEEDVFRLVDHVVESRKKEALKTVERLYAEGVRAPEIIAAFAGQLERYDRAVKALKLGRRMEEIGESLRVPSFIQPAFWSTVKRLSEDKLKNLASTLLACDESFKTGQADEKRAIEKFILTS